MVCPPAKIINVFMVRTMMEMIKTGHGGWTTCLLVPADPARSTSVREYALVLVATRHNHGAIKLVNLSHVEVNQTPLPPLFIQRSGGMSWFVF